MAVVEVETGIQLLFPEHNTGLQLSETDALETAAIICEAFIARGWDSYDTGEIRITGQVGGEIVMKINRKMDRGII